MWSNLLGWKVNDKLMGSFKKEKKKKNNCEPISSRLQKNIVQVFFIFYLHRLTYTNLLVDVVLAAICSISWEKRQSVKLKQLKLKKVKFYDLNFSHLSYWILILCEANHDETTS